MKKMGGQSRYARKSSRAFLSETLELRRLLSNSLLFSVDTTSVNAGAPIDPLTGIQVSVVNAQGAVQYGNTDRIMLTLSSNPTGTTLNGGVLARAVNGTAIFTNISIPQASNGYVLRAYDFDNNAVSAAYSSPFNVDLLPFFSSLVSLTNGPAGTTPVGDLVSDSSGNLFGVTEYGGLYGDGTVFELSGASHSVYTTLLSFTGLGGSVPGASPVAGLTFDSAGDLFGTTQYDGPTSSNQGTVFELSGANHQTYSLLYSFSSVAGNPTSPLLLDSSGNLYGATLFGGANGYGSVYKLTPNPLGGLLTTLVSFAGNSGFNSMGLHGQNPVGRMVFDSQGNLFGVTMGGGSNSGVFGGFGGTIFEIPVSNPSQAFTLSDQLYAPGSIAGSEPEAGLTIDSSGDLFGTTSGGGQSGEGTVFEIPANAPTTLDYLASFTGSGGSDPGASPQSDLTFDAAGNLYGTTETGGNFNDGTAFELLPYGGGPQSSLDTFSSLVSFTATTANAPTGGLLIDSSGNLYGLSQAGGANGQGLAYVIPASNQTSINSLFSFAGGAGTGPFGTLAIDSSGDLFGTTETGGLHGDGTVFELSGDVYTPLLSFSGGSGPDIGQEPVGNLVFDAAGNLYGTTTQGGTSGEGTVFELSGPNFSTFTSLVSFTGNTGTAPGYYPYPQMAFDSAGNLYGTTAEGGAANDGTVFELSGANHQTFTSLVSFTGNTGAKPGSFPQPGLTIDGNGNILGVASSGGVSKMGTVFELSGSNHTTFTTLVSFTGTTGNFPGSGPAGNLVIDSSGNVYGTTSGGGANGDGTLFFLAAPGYAFGSLVSFTGNSGAELGASPNAGVLVYSNGNIYGTTELGGSEGNGTVFEFSPSLNTLSTILSFTGMGGANPGAYPLGGLVQDAGGNLFGTTRDGGNYGQGTIFEIADGGSTAVNISSGSVTIAPPGGNGTNTTETFSAISVGPGGSISVSPSNTSSPTVISTAALSLAGSIGNWTSTVDIANNDLDLTSGVSPGIVPLTTPAPSMLATVTDQARQGFASGAWNGAGLASVSAAADSSHLTAIAVIQNNQSGTAIYGANNPFDGTTPGASDVLVKYTYYGDSNLDGHVDGSDYTLIDNGFLNHLTGWFNGDYNYDGIIDGSDYTLIDNAFNRQTVSLASQLATPAGKPVTAVFSQTAFTDTTAPPVIAAPSTADEILTMSLGGENSPYIGQR